MSIEDDPTDFDGSLGILPVIPDGSSSPLFNDPRTNAATGASAAGVRAFTAQAVAFYFRAPVKAFFRTRVDYLVGRTGLEQELAREVTCFAGVREIHRQPGCPERRLYLAHNYSGFTRQCGWKLWLAFHPRTTAPSASSKYCCRGGSIYFVPSDSGSSP